MSKKNIKRLGLFFAAPFFVVILYLSAALLGGLIPSSQNSSVVSEPQDKQIYLTANALHADIAIPVDAITSQQFSFLKDAGFPLENPNLKFLIIGWGSREFYTSTANYSDVRLGTVWQAATGDASVMHIAPAGDVSSSENAFKVDMTEKGFNQMLEFILNSFQQEDEKVQLLPNATFGYGDVFYEAKGRFSIFNPCNVWVSNALSKAGVSTGLWTPTTYSLLLHNKIYH